MWRAALVALAVLAGGCSSSGKRPDPVPVVLTWTPSDATDEGEPVTDLVNYRLEWKSFVSTSPIASSLYLPPNETRYSLSLPRGKWRVAVVAISESRGERKSNEVIVQR